MPIEINRTMRLPAGEFRPPTDVAKTGTCLHHAVGGTARSTFWWKRDHNKTG